MAVRSSNGVIERSKVFKIADLLGIDAANTYRVTINPNDIEVIAFQRDEDGARFASKDGVGYEKSLLKFDIADEEDANV